MVDASFGFTQGHAAPVLEVEGRAREGIEPTSVAFARAVEALRSDLTDARLHESMSPDGSRWSLRFTLTDLGAVADTAEAETAP